MNRTVLDDHNTYTTRVESSLHRVGLRLARHRHRSLRSGLVGAESPPAGDARDPASRRPPTLTRGAGGLGVLGAVGLVPPCGQLHGATHAGHGQLDARGARDRNALAHRYLNPP